MTAKTKQAFYGKQKLWVAGAHMSSLILVMFVRGKDRLGVGAR